MILKMLPESLTMIRMDALLMVIMIMLMAEIVMMRPNKSITINNTTATKLILMGDTCNDRQ